MKRKTHFHFKQFSVRHDQCTMKVGTDAVLLGSWAIVNGAKKILDIGTGSGIIALMAAQRTSDTTIDAVEIEKKNAEQAHENVLNSPWSAKVAVHNISIQEFTAASPYDVIISNPPYFTNSQVPPDQRRHQTRHTVSLDYISLIGAVQRLLKPNGKFNVILPYSEGLQFINLAAQSSLFCSRKHSFRTRPSKPIERWLMEFSYHESPTQEGEILLYEKGLVWSDSYVSLTRDFYLKL
jgi:tRNA1Val (adenine37-N6)-methyltransferase